MSRYSQARLSGLDFPTTPVQGDLVIGRRGIFVRPFDELAIVDKVTFNELSLDQKLSWILYYQDVFYKLQSLGLNFSSRSFAVGPTAIQIIPPNRYPRGYEIFNPQAPSTNNTFLASAFSPSPVSLFVGSTFGTIFTQASQFRRIGCYLTILSIGTPQIIQQEPILQVNALSLDPTSGIFFPVFPDIFEGFQEQQTISGPNVVGGKKYVNLGPAGVDNQIQFEAVATIGGIKIELGLVFKDSAVVQVGSSTGLDLSTIYIGPNQGVTPTNGIPLIPGARLPFWLQENVPIWGITESSTNKLVVQDKQ